MKAVAASSAHRPPCPILLDGAATRSWGGGGWPVPTPAWHPGYAGVRIAWWKAVAGAGPILVEMCDACCWLDVGCVGLNASLMLHL